MVTLRKFYDEHPINETAILKNLADKGISRNKITPEDLSRFDEDHYNGLHATDVLAERLAIKSGMNILDLCSGVGGTSRYLAYRQGVTVIGIDSNDSRVECARDLTRLVGLEDHVTYRFGDATKTELSDAAVDRIVSQESFMHIADREALFAECLRVLKPKGGLGYTDWTCTDLLGEEPRRKLADGMAAARIMSAEENVSLLRAAGFTNVSAEDLSKEWREILGARLEMYRSMKPETVASFGEARHATYVKNYEFFVAQIDAGALGGGRIIAWKDQGAPR